MSVQVSSGSNAQKRARSTFGNFNTLSTTYVTALSIQGKGEIKYLVVYKATAGQENIRVTLDGNVIPAITLGATTYYAMMDWGNGLAGNTLSNPPSINGFSFNQSLLVEILTNDANTAAVLYHVDIE